ncbi:hypothetical protein ACFLTI_08580 [Bacteroidota bacterium]
MAKTNWFQKLDTKISKEERARILLSVFSSISNLDDLSIDVIPYEILDKRIPESAALANFRASLINHNHDTLPDKEINHGDIINTQELYREILEQIKLLEPQVENENKEVEDAKKLYLENPNKYFVKSLSPTEDRNKPYGKIIVSNWVEFEIYNAKRIDEFNLETKKWERRQLFIKGCKAEVIKALKHLEDKVKSFSNKKNTKVKKSTNNSSLKLLNFNTLGEGLTDVLRFLKSKGMIHEDVKAHEFKKVFSEEPGDIKIIWIGPKNALGYLFKFWKDKNLFSNTSQGYWLSVIKHFIVESKNKKNTTNLRTVHKPKAEISRIIEDTIEYLK